MTHRSIYIAALLLTFSVAGATAHGRVGDDELSNDSILASLHSETLKSSKDAQSATLSECLEKGLDKNYSLRIIRNKEQMAANNATMENAGMLPSVSLSAGYNGSAYSRNTQSRDGATTQDHGVYDDGLNAGIDLSWTLFDGFKTVANYDRLRELSLISSTQTRLAVEDYMADLILLLVVMLVRHLKFLLMLPMIPIALLYNAMNSQVLLSEKLSILGLMVQLTYSLV